MRTSTDYNVRGASGPRPEVRGQGSGARCRGPESGGRNVRRYPLPTTHYPPPVCHWLSQCPPSSRGFTLVEMLVVVSIMMLLVTVAATAFRPADDSRRIREAARSINVYLSSARNRALEIGRPCGVILRRFPGTACAMTLEQCEVPPSYAGETNEAAVVVQDWTLSGGASYWGDGSTILKIRVRGGAGGATEFTNNLMHHGDLIQLNAQGSYYAIVNDPSDGPPPADDDFPLLGSGGDPNTINFQVGNDTSSDGWIDDRWLTLRLEPLYSQLTPWPTVVSGNWSQPVSFRIFRSPMSGTSIVKSASRTLQLPAATVVDLQFSGCGNGQFVPTWNNTVNYDVGDRVVSQDGLTYTCVQANVNRLPESNTPAYWQQIPFPNIAVLFAPNGSIDNVYVGGTSYRITDPIFLLVGKREKVPPPTYVAGNPDTFANWQDLNNLWVTINSQTGLITTGVVAAVAAAGTYNDARILARDAQGMGGK